MAKCELTVKLDEPLRAYRGGELVKGHVTVHVDRDVTCNGLTIRSLWESHGKGNVDRDTHHEIIAFEGTWPAGTIEQYRFELPCANWPPTYHGFLLNVDHYIEAQADIPWAIDPKAKQPFQLVPHLDGAFKVDKPAPTEITGPVGTFIAGIVIAVICVAAALFLFHPCFWIFGLAAGGWWFVTKYLPRMKLGEVELNIITPSVTPGQDFKAEIVLTPKRSVPISAVNWKITANEVCVHGSGTNKSTHTHNLFEHVHTSDRDTELRPNQQHRFVFELALPPEAPFSLDLDNNDLKWTVEAHVDILRWPDWKKQAEFQVLPIDGVNKATPSIPEAEPVRQTSSVSFDDTLSMIAKVRTNFDQLDKVIAAVSGADMSMTIRLERPIGLGALDPAVGFSNGLAFEGSSDDLSLPMLIYVPDERRDEFAGRLGTTWTGWGQIIGYDHQTGSLQLKATGR